MSGVETDDPSIDMTAAEYVLGTLEPAEVAAAEARQRADGAFAAEIRSWETRLFPLTALVAGVPPPATLWPRIEATIGGASPALAPTAANDNRLRFWRITALGAMAVAASLALFVALRPTPPPVFAVLSPTGVTAPVLVAFGTSDTVGLRPSAAIAVAPDRDLQLWSLSAGATRPASLGVLPANGKQLPSGILPGTKLLVSLEPKGGSPTGQPTGPVVYGGTLERFK